MLNLVSRVPGTGFKEPRKMVFVVYFRILFGRSRVSEIGTSRQNLGAVLKHRLYQKYQE